MSWTKRQIIEQGFEEVGLASYVYDLTPEQLSSALRKLDMMIAGWTRKSIHLGYPITSNPDDSSLDTQSNIPNSKIEAVTLNLGIRIAPSFGKAVSVETKGLAKSAFRALIPTVKPQEMQLPNTMASGAGNRVYSRPFLNTPDTSPIRTCDDGQLIITE